MPSNVPRYTASCLMHHSQSIAVASVDSMGLVTARVWDLLGNEQIIDRQQASLALMND